jgi:hypothetical protein
MQTGEHTTQKPSLHATISKELHGCHTTRSILHTAITALLFFECLKTLLIVCAASCERILLAGSAWPTFGIRTRKRVATIWDSAPLPQPPQRTPMRLVERRWVTVCTAQSHMRRACHADRPTRQVVLL